MSRFSKIFNSVKCAVIGMIHVQALPGTPQSSYSVQQIVDYACKEAIIYGKSGVDGLIVENMFDIPYVSEEVGPEITAVMTRVCTEVKKTVGKIPCGIQILSGNNVAATAVALAAGLQFVRVESFVFSHVADEGLMNACAGSLLRYAKTIGAREILYLTDIKKKHSSHAITSDVSVSQMAKAAEFFLSDGVILTGMETGDPPNVENLKDKWLMENMKNCQEIFKKKKKKKRQHTSDVPNIIYKLQFYYHSSLSALKLRNLTSKNGSIMGNVQEATKLPVLIGSGMTLDNIEKYISADGVIVGSHFKHDGHWTGQADGKRISKFMDTVQRFR